MARARRQWGLLAYRLPREPSAPRVTLWRKLRRLGAEQLADGVVVLPLGPRNREQLEWLAEDVIGAGGSATVWTANLPTAADERALVRQMTDRVAAEYRALIAEAETADPRPGTVSRLRRELRAIRARDYFGAQDREPAQRVVDALAARAGRVVA